MGERLTEPLSPERVAEIREHADGFEIVELCDTVEALRAKNDSQWKANERLARDVAALSAGMDETGPLLGILRERDEMAAELAAARSGIEWSRAEMEALRAEIERLQHAVGEQTARGDKLKNRASTLKERVKKARADRDQVREELEDAQAYVIVASRVLDEREILRGIAKRLREGWISAEPEPDLPARWFNMRDIERMTEAEVQAIYGTEQEG